MLTVALLIVVLAAVAAGYFVLSRALPALRDGVVGSVDARLGAIDERLDRRFVDLEAKVYRRLEGIDGRLLASQQNAGKTATEIVDRLGELDGTAAQMLARANDLARLEQALRPPKARGGFGELLLENLLRDRLPPTAYSVQHTFATGDRVDAVVRVDRLIPVDSKFPLDNYHRMAEAEGDDERTLAERQFARDVRNHIDAIAAKYIRPSEGTYDFAFMYVPVESVYYELACGKTGALLQYAHEKRVFPVSPTTFVAYLQVIVLGLRGMQIEQHAHEVMAYVADLQHDFERFADDFALVGKHLDNAASKFASADKRLGKLEDKLDRAVEEQETLEVDEVLELPGAAADAA